MGKKLLILIFTIAFIAGSLVTGSIAFGEDGLTKLQKKCAKEPETPQKIQPECELLKLINAIPAGPPGEPGVSPTVVTEPAGTNCSDGGVKITDSFFDVFYVCNGVQGVQGEQGTSTSVIRFDSGNNPEVNVTPLFFIDGENSGSPLNGFKDFRRGATLVGVDGVITELRYDIGLAAINDLTITTSLWKNNVVIASCSVTTGPSSTSCVASLNEPVSAGDLVAVSDVSLSENVGLSFRHAAVVVTT